MYIMSSSKRMSQISEESKISEYSAHRSNPNSARIKFELCVEDNWSHQSQEEHEKRLSNLRKEIEFIQSTDWIYGPIEKYIGQIQVPKHKS